MVASTDDTRQSVPLTGSAHQVSSFRGWVGRIRGRLQWAPRDASLASGCSKLHRSLTNVFTSSLPGSSLAVPSSGDLTSSLQPRVRRRGDLPRVTSLASHSLSSATDFKSDPRTWSVKSGLVTPPPELESETALLCERHRPRPPLGPSVSFDSP